jgi:hypothetical protein
MCVRGIGNPSWEEHNGSLAPFERVSPYIDTLRGCNHSRGPDALFRVACVLVNGLALPDEQAWPILLDTMPGATTVE